jgi:hypothetical protein
VQKLAKNSELTTQQQKASQFTIKIFQSDILDTAKIIFFVRILVP